MLTNSIRWEVFTIEEKTNLKKAMNKGDYKIFTNLINEMDPFKEAEISKLVDLYRSQEEGYESEVRNELNGPKGFLNKDVHDMTPEEEDKWQKKLDEEKEKHANRSKNKVEVEVEGEKEEKKEEKDKKKEEKKTKK